MPTIVFSGYVLPPSAEVNAHGTLDWKDDNIAFPLIYRIEKSKLIVQCDVETVTDLTVNYTHQVAYTQIRGVLDAISFTEGVGLRLIIDYCTLPNSGPLLLRSGTASLKTLCPFTPQEVVDAITKERRLLKPFNDLTETLHNPLDSFVNAHRAIEGLCRLISNDNNRSRRWESLRENLNISRPYLDFITNLSKGARHGETGPIPM